MSCPFGSAFVPGPLDERATSTQPGSGGSASCGAVVPGLSDLRSAFTPSPEPLGRVMWQPAFGVMSSWKIGGLVPGLNASQEPNMPRPTLTANWSMTSWVVSEPTATYVVYGSANAGAARPSTSA